MLWRRKWQPLESRYSMGLLPDILEVPEVASGLISPDPREGLPTLPPGIFERTVEAVMDDYPIDQDSTALSAQNPTSQFDGIDNAKQKTRDDVIFLTKHGWRYITRSRYAYGWHFYWHHEKLQKRNGLWFTQGEALRLQKFLNRRKEKC